MKPPAFQFYADDFLAGVADMTQAEVGSYILLLAHQWSRGEIPADANRLALVAKGEASAHVLAKFPGGKNARLEVERKKQDDWREKQRQNGIASGKARLNGRSTTVQPSFNDTPNQTGTNGQPNGNSPSPSPSPTTIHALYGEIPTLDELKAYAAVQAIPESSVKSFHEHHAGNSLWLNQHGILINWKIKLKSWSEKDRQPKPNHANFRTSAPDRNAGTLNANITPEQLAKLKSKVR